MRQPQFPHSECPIRRSNSTDPPHPNPVHIHLSEEVNNTATAVTVLIRRRVFLGFEKGPTFAGKNPAKPLHRVDPFVGDPRVKRQGAAIPVADVAACGGGVTVVSVGVEKDDLEGAWGKANKMAKVGKGCCGKRREGDGNGVV
ncbi:MARTX multifunctional-autoprocessing repeats-in-toxin holotoxin [Sesbania bispinosa]|nr:MARTX multifunctional-autoprocessing repeats-in-toxin holotoxin [Sesbania bispinosa]